jgi:hypothetical protein
VSSPLPPLILDQFRDAASKFASDLSGTPLPDLFGTTDGKAVGKKV